jgi:uncharacterized protein (TIGR03086 family)
MDLHRFVRALDGFEAVLAAVPPGRWDAPSPCQGWSAGDVAAHMTGGLRAVEDLAAGRESEPRDDSPAPPADGDRLAAWRTARAAMMTALDPAALSLPVPLPWGELMPLGEFLERFPMEFLVHTWDLAQATGQRAVLDPDLVRAALEPARQFGPAFREADMIGPQIPVPGSADDLTRLLALFGRTA